MNQCLFCGSSEHTYNINEEKGKYTVKSNMLDFFGFQVESYLLEDDVLCHVCTSILETFSKLKRRLLPFIIDRLDKKINRVTPVRFGKVWDLFASTPMDEEEAGTLMGTRTPTPSLMKYRRSKPYEKYLEVQIAKREQIRSLSRTSSNHFSESSTNSTKSKRRRKRKGRGRKQYNNNSTYGYRSSIYSSIEYFRRSSPANSDDSDRSFDETFYKRKRKTKSRSSVNSEGYRTPSRRTRSVSRLQEMEANKLAELEADLYTCPDAKCQQIFTDLEEFTYHKIVEHHHLALFICDNGCENRYTTREELQIHFRQVHDNSSVNCLMCGEEFEGTEVLQEHIQRHMEYTVPCIYCDKLFLNIHERDVHVKESHKGRKVRIRERVQGIVDRVDKNESDEDDDEVTIESTVPENKINNFGNKNFDVRILIQEWKDPNDDSLYCDKQIK